MLHKLHLLRFMPFMGMVVTCFTLQAQEEPNDIWTLERCLEHALEHNIQIQQAELGIAQGELTKLAAVGAFLPNVNLSSFYSPPVGTLIGENGISASGGRANVNLSSGLVLYNGWQNHLNLRRAKVGLERAQSGVEVAQNNVALQLASAYLNVLFQKEFLRIAQFNQEATGRQVDRVQKLVNAGAAAESDLIDVLAQQASDISATVSAENGVTIAKLALSQLLLLDGDEAEAMDVAPPSEDPLNGVELPVTAEAATSFALQHFPEMKVADLDITDAYLAVDLAKARRMPRVSVSPGANSSYFDNPTLPSFGEQISTISPNISLSMSVPIFNGFGIHTSVERAKVGVLSAELAKAQTAQTLAQTVEQAWADARAAERTFEANDRTLEAASLAMTNAEARFEAGAISALEYADARTRLDNARINALRTQYDFVFKTRILDFYLGKPLSL